ncbi:hypothetical protein DDE18_08260 [Nocardioides gansuensis]|uniref:DUF5709 domain-containing protein n=1 Tax=Nocardioides gansuensis TaxID=2138300 RepID=A0A2T8FC49_9ACTN|nr:DUF5709 domain-containing protein [Nocardioides gansuensis]PVG83280.1 hypothetical protein DDE18_08260 [Nocardioides gansuensis]
MTEDREMYGDQPVDDEDQLQPEDTLEDQDLDDVLDRGYSPPDRPPHGYDDRPTGSELLEGESLEERISQEEPEPDPYAEQPQPDENALPEDIDYGATPDPRAGRLVQPDEGTGDDVISQEVARDVGIDGAGASAEEAAMHLTAEPEPPDEEP